jgi:DivIVA domain-containing protein
VDRDAIERRDFPVGRRGYDTSAVDAHLRAVADEIEALRERAAAPAPAPRRGIAAGASDQVRQILEAAERSATELREQAAKDAGEHITRVETSADQMMGRLDGLQRELDGLFDALRRSGAVLEDGLTKLRDEVSAAGEPEDAPAVEPPAVEAPAGDGNGALPADEAGARLIALGGTPREETARYLSEHYSLADPGALLDDVYARAGGSAG